MSTSDHSIEAYVENATPASTDSVGYEAPATHFLLIRFGTRIWLLGGPSHCA